MPHQSRENYSWNRDPDKIGQSPRWFKRKPGAHPRRRGFACGLGFGGKGARRAIFKDAAVTLAMEYYLTMPVTVQTGHCKRVPSSTGGMLATGIRHGTDCHGPKHD